MKPRKTAPRHPLYRWECDECDQWEVVREGLAVTRRHAADHMEDADHDNVTIYLIAEYWETSRPAEVPTA